MNGVLARSRAFPTIGLILLGGLSDTRKRFPLHASAGIAYTNLKGETYSETSIFMGDNPIGTIDGVPVSDNYRSPFAVIRKYRDVLDQAGYDVSKLGFRSENRGIVSGSSDSGAAAFGASLEAISKTSLDLQELENDLRVISESVGRSLHGGLTVTEVVNGVPVTDQLAGPDAFSGYTIVAGRFNHKRKPSDAIHTNIVKSPEYEKRIESANRKAKLLRELVDDKDWDGVFELAKEDTDEYHRIIESVGVRIIEDDMRKFIRMLRELSREVWCPYIVTGGPNVFVITHRDDANFIAEKSIDYGASPVILKVAGGPITFSP